MVVVVVCSHPVGFSIEKSIAAFKQNRVFLSFYYDLFNHLEQGRPFERNT